jgi:heme/copper-type cytochrome/quinol oxidase subunit 1
LGGQWMTFLPIFWVGYAGLPRRVHDYPVVFIGWHGMSTVGHMVTLISLCLFFTMFLDSHIEQKVCIHNSLGMPRWYKRIIYLKFKIKYIQLTWKNLYRTPTKLVRVYLNQPYFNMYERFEMTK